MDIRYIAGFFDGEGSVNLVAKWEKTGYFKSQVRISIGNINYEVIAKLKEQFGGSLTISQKKKDNHRQCYKWWLSCQQASQFLREILPYLIVKRKQAELALEFQNMINNHSKVFKKHGLSETEILERIEMKRKISTINNKEEFLIN